MSESLYELFKNISKEILDWFSYYSTFQFVAWKSGIWLRLRRYKNVCVIHGSDQLKRMWYDSKLWVLYDKIFCSAPQGAIPATVGVIKGQLTVGLSDEEIETLGSSVKHREKNKASSESTSPPVVKVSRRDLPYVLSHVSTTHSLLLFLKKLGRFGWFLQKVIF